MRWQAYTIPDTCLILLSEQAHDYSKCHVYTKCLNCTLFSRKRSSKGETISQRWGLAVTSMIHAEERSMCYSWLSYFFLEKCSTEESFSTILVGCWFMVICERLTNTMYWIVLAIQCLAAIKLWCFPCPAIDHFASFFSFLFFPGFCFDIVAVYNP